MPARWLAGALEKRLHSVDAGEVDGDVAIQEVLDDHHGVIALFDRLRVEVLCELREIGVVVENCGGNVLVRRIEFVANLIVQQRMEFGFASVAHCCHADDVNAGQRYFHRSYG